MIKKILIANRGEIACRIIRTCKKLGIESVAVYSDIDQWASFTVQADEAWAIGGNAPAESYLNGNLIIQTALDSGADAIHPGYGFLSENPVFAKAVVDAGLIFIGPSPEAISTMGNKLTAKEAVRSFNIPMVPGTDGAISDLNTARESADAIGYPVMLKAAAGGGGKGMRIVERSEDFVEHYKRATSEAVTAFNNGEVFVEKFVVNPRHIEIQVIADNHGNVCHMFERDCSVQRRHQKVIEEAPSSILTDDLRNRMGQAAIDAAKACNYSGVGTVEFLVDANLDFYFLEMNTRLQVEHPVTEMITGLDLVELQILVANGGKLPFRQEDLRIHGHAMELRVYAEDPYSGFLPSVGKLKKYVEPQGPNIRVDGGYQHGDEIPMFYDPLIAKLVVWGHDRIQCIQQLKLAVEQFDIDGLETTLPFGLFVCNQSNFVSGNFDTDFVNKFFNESLRNVIMLEQETIAAHVANLLHQMSADNTTVHSYVSSWRERR